MNKIAIVFGGDSVESEISVLSALKVKEEFEHQNWDHLFIFLDHQGSFYSGKKLCSLENYAEKKGFLKGSFGKKDVFPFFKTGMKKEYFDEALIVGHGKGIEDGTVGAFFETLKIPVIFAGIENSCLIQNKYLFKKVLKNNRVPYVHYLKIDKKEFETKREKLKKRILTFGLPCIVKPSRLGSSIGITVIKKEEEIELALSNSFSYDDQSIVEKLVTHKKEINIAILGDSEEQYLSQFEIVNTKESMLDFFDKYDYSSSNSKRKITGEMDEDIKERIRNYALKVFRSLNLFGVVRFDFIFDEETRELFLNEANLIPGSLAYYLFEPVGITFGVLLEKWIKYGENVFSKRKRLVNTFEEGFISSHPFMGIKK